MTFYYKGLPTTDLGEHYMALARSGFMRDAPSKKIVLDRLVLILIFALVAFFSSAGCTPAALSAADLIGRSAARVLGWCEQAPGAEKTRLARARQAIEDEDLIAAAALLHEAVTELRESGKEPPADVAGSQMLLGALAAEAIQNGMRALSAAPDETRAP